MRRRHKANASPTPPLATQATSAGFPTEGDVTAGVDATVPGPFVFHMLIEAIVTTIEQAGLTPDDDPEQFRDALVSLINTAGVGFATNQQTIDGVLTNVATNPRGVRAAIDALIDAAPGALDTLNELAAAIDDDANFATTVTNQIAATRNMVLYDQDIAVPITGHTEVQLTDSVADFRWIELIYECPGRGGVTAAQRIRVADLTGAPVISESTSSVVYASGTSLPDALYRVDRVTGVVTFIRGLTGITGPYSMAELDRTLYIIDVGPGGELSPPQLWRVPLDTLELIFVADVISIGTGDVTDNFALGQLDGTIYALPSDTSDPQVWTLNVQTGAMTALPNSFGSQANQSFSGMAGVGGVLYAFNQNTSMLLSIDTATGDDTIIGRPRFSTGSGNIQISSLAGIGDTLYGVRRVNPSTDEWLIGTLGVTPMTLGGSPNSLLWTDLGQLFENGELLDNQIVGLAAAEQVTTSLSKGVCLIGDDDPALAAWSDTGDDTQLRLVAAPAAMTVKQVVGIK